MNHLQLSSLNLFSSQTTDRAPEQRSTETTLACLINSESSRFLPVSGTNVLVRREASGYRAALLSLIEFEKTFGVLADYVYLGANLISIILQPWSRRIPLITGNSSTSGLVLHYWTSAMLHF